MSLGFKNAGFDITSAYEVWDTAIECYNLNFGNLAVKADLSDPNTVIPQIRKDNPDIIIGGPPCQDFSIAGKRVECKRADLTLCFSEIVDRVCPRFFVMENVDRILKSNTYKRAREIFKNAGYGLTECVMNASYYGVPQNRRRFICVGALGAQDDFIEDRLLQKMSDEPLTLRQYFGNSLDFEYYYRHPWSYSRRGVFSIDEPAPTMRGVNRPVPGGYPGHPGDACKLNDDLRALTTLERSLIQTFPHTFKWTGSKTDKELMIGNAVPVKLAEFIACAIMDFVKKENVAEDIPDGERYKSWLMSEKNYGKRSANDSLSRLKRARDIYNSELDDYYIFELERTEEFKSLTTTVRSQLKNSIRLYSEFRSASLVSD
jgi:DNA (cytosine-5)-methyltransferase 1